MDSNLHKRVSLSEFAEVANLSAYHLSHLFKKQTGLSPQKQLRALRMQRASQLLATTLLSIKHIMVTVGYSDKSHFAHHFRAVFGVSPSKYREQFRDLTLLKNRLRRQQRKNG
jgi:transcriptional regulator GlxA family with amidase domain